MIRIPYQPQMKADTTRGAYACFGTCRLTPAADYSKEALVTSSSLDRGCILQSRTSRGLGLGAFHSPAGRRVSVIAPRFRRCDRAHRYSDRQVSCAAPVVHQSLAFRGGWSSMTNPSEKRGQGRANHTQACVAVGQGRGGSRE